MLSFNDCYHFATFALSNLLHILLSEHSLKSIEDIMTIHTKVYCVCQHVYHNIKASFLYNYNTTIMLKVKNSYNLCSHFSRGPPDIFCNRLFWNQCPIMYYIRFALVSFKFLI